MDFSGTPNGCPLDLRLSAGMRKLPNAPDILVTLFKAFLEQGGFYLQLDTVDAATLRAAQKDPDRFPNLVVRISGWSARFASLSKECIFLGINKYIELWDAAAYKAYLDENEPVFREAAEELRSIYL